MAYCKYSVFWRRNKECVDYDIWLLIIVIYDLYECFIYKQSICKKIIEVLIIAVNHVLYVLTKTKKVYLNHNFNSVKICHLGHLV